jgi:hypothetical protein
VPTRLPNLLIAGVTKAGTTALFSYLGQHPDVCPSVVKEPDYFSPFAAGGAPEMTLDEYERCFSSCGDERYRMEATPRYFFGGARVVDAVERTLESPRALVLLRDPVARFWSNYQYKKLQRQIDAGLRFDEFLDRCLVVPRGPALSPEDLTTFRALVTGCYVDYVPAWSTALGDRFRVVFSEELAADPAAVVRSLCSWLDLEGSVVGRFSFDVRNRTVPPRSYAVHKAARSLYGRTRSALAARPELQERARRVYEAINGARNAERLTPERRRRLAAYYRDPNAALAAALRKAGYSRLPSWLEDA